MRDSVGVEPTIPQSWNAYSYVGINPLRFIDPLGLKSECPDGNSDKSCQQEENPQLEAGIYANADGQQFFVDEQGNVAAIYENSGNGPSAIASFDLATAGIGTITRKAAMAALKKLMGKKAAKELLEVGTKRANTTKAIQEALSDPKRVQHASQNLIDAGIIAQRGAVTATREIAQEIMERPLYTFQSLMATSGQPIEVFMGLVNGKGVGIAVATEGTASIRKGQLVTALTYGK